MCDTNKEPGFSKYECKLILNQIERRAQYRKEFLKQRTDPRKHASESGYVFDSAIQRFVAMKATQYDHFRATPKTSISGFCLIVVPMLSYGYLMWLQRSKFLDECSSGKILYRDRLFKFQ